MTDLEKLLAGRKLVDEYRAAHASRGVHEVEKLISGLKELGFVSIEDFFAFNQVMNLAEIKRCTVYIGQCDNCQGKESKGCVQSCYNVKTKGGTKQLVADVNDTLSHRKYWKDYYYSRPPIKVGEAPRSILPGCSISYKSIDNFLFDIRWE
jgi:hypothetical protein